MNMQTDNHRALAKGQIWKTGAADFEIMALGRRFIHYKVTKQLGLRRVSVQVSGIEALGDYLKRNEARLVSGASRN